MKNNEKGWSDGICMAWHKKNKKRCHRPVANDHTDFCPYHHFYDDQLLKKRKQLDKKQLNITNNILSQAVNSLESLIIDNIVKTSTDSITKQCDEKWTEGLMYIHDDWSKIPIEERIILDKTCYVLLDIILYVEASLNRSNMGNVSPAFPVNPYTRQPFTRDA